jgi:hypothetical protein
MTMSKFLSVALLAGASAIAAFVPSQAEAVPVAFWSGSSVTVNGSAGFNTMGITAFGTQSVSDADGSASVQSTPTPLPAITSMATTGATGTASEATATLYYYFDISGPGGIMPGASVNVIASGSLFSDIGATSTDFLRVAGATIVNATSVGGNNNGAFTTSATVSPLYFNVDYLVEKTVFAFANPSGTATTFLDPYFFLDQNLVDLGYSIITSPGIGNSLASATPLPAALPLFAGGLGMMGWLSRRRKRKGLAAIAVA